MKTEIKGFKDEYEFLSNTYKSPIVIDGIVYQNANDAYLDLQKRNKAFAEDWDKIRKNNMKRAVLAKFEQNPELAEKLLATGHQKLINKSKYNDLCWGVCYGKGANALGKILASVRSTLRKQQKAKKEQQFIIE